VTIVSNAMRVSIAAREEGLDLTGLAFLGGWIEQISALFQNETGRYIGVITSLLIPSESLWQLAAIAGSARANPARNAAAKPARLLIAMIDCSPFVGRPYGLPSGLWSWL
jgi:hypothetical protein